MRVKPLLAYLITLKSSFVNGHETEYSSNFNVKEPSCSGFRVSDVVIVLVLVLRRCVFRAALSTGRLRGNLMRHCFMKRDMLRFG